MSTSRPLQYWGVGVALSEEESFEGGVELGWISVVDNRRGGGNVPDLRTSNDLADDLPLFADLSPHFPGIWATRVKGRYAWPWRGLKMEWKFYGLFFDECLANEVRKEEKKRGHIFFCYIWFLQLHWWHAEADRGDGKVNQSELKCRSGSLVGLKVF